MRLFISRHGEAVGSAATDALRPLTERGQRDLVTHWQGLKESGVNLSGMVVSPYLRAQQTADCIAEVYSGLPRTDCDELVPEASPLLLLNSLLANPVAENTVLVSHMPLVAQLVGMWTGSTDRIGFAVGTVACLDVDVAAVAGARLLWLCSPGESLAGR